MSAALLDAAVGSEMLVDGRRWLVDRLELQHGRIGLTVEDGQRCWRSIRYLIDHATFQDSAELGAAANRNRQPKVLTDLTPHQRDLVGLRVGHLLEVETGYRSGDPLRPGPGEPQSQYAAGEGAVIQI
jgi:hypothetical protein